MQFTNFFPAEKYFLDPLRCQIGAILPFLFEAKTFTLESGNPFVTAIAAAGIQQCCAIFQTSFGILMRLRAERFVRQKLE